MSAVGVRICASGKPVWQRKSRATAGKHCCHRPVRCNFQKGSTGYEAPSVAPAATELAELERLSVVVPDTLLLESSTSPPKAATVSCSMLHQLLNNPSIGNRQYENAIEAAVTYERCTNLAADERAAYQLDKALVNLGALFASVVAGRVCTEVDPRLCNDSESMVKRVGRLVQLYEEVDVRREKLIFRLPATWQGIQASKRLEATGIATQLFLVYSLAQGIAAMQAGASVVQPNVGRVRDWFNQNPGVIRDPKGPREDSGFASRVDPGVLLTQQLYTYAKKFHPRTAIMASGLRTKEEALALAGCDYLVLGPKVLAELASTPTLAGYNDDLHAGASSDAGSLPRLLSPDMAAASETTRMPEFNEGTFNEGLGHAGRELLKVSLQGLVSDADSVLPYFKQLAVSAE